MSETALLEGDSLLDQAYLRLAYISIYFLVEHRLKESFKMKMTETFLTAVLVSVCHYLGMHISRTTILKHAFVR